MSGCWEKHHRVTCSKETKRIQRRLGWGLQGPPLQLAYCFPTWKQRQSTCWEMRAVPDCREIWEPGTTVLPGGSPGASRARKGVECAVGLRLSGLLAGLQLPPSPRKRPHETLSLGLLEAGSGQNKCSHGGTLGLISPYLSGQVMLFASPFWCGMEAPSLSEAVISSKTG